MKRKSSRGFAPALSLGAFYTIVFACSAPAAARTKSDNNHALDQASSWAGIAPGVADIANWSGTYNTAGSLTAALPASGLSWQGLTVGSISGTASGSVVVGGNGVAVVGSVLTVGASGITMTGANRDLCSMRRRSILMSASRGRCPQVGTCGWVTGR